MFGEVQKSLVSDSKDRASLIFYAVHLIEVYRTP
jgi:hypothetical protein